MEEKISVTIERHLGNLTDPRIDRTKLHRLLDLVEVATYAVVAGADN